MELHAKFLQVSSREIRDLKVNTKYPIIRAERAMTHLGHTVLLTVLDAPNSVLKLFLPKRYARVVSDTDIVHINMNPEFHSNFHIVHINMNPEFHSLIFTLYT